MYIVNAHAHVRVDKEGVLRIGGMSIDEYVLYCKKLGIQKACVSCLNNESKAESNMLVYSLMERFPDFYAGMISTKMEELEPERIKYLVNLGFKGIKLINPMKDYNDKKYFRIYETAENLNIPILFHTGYVAGDCKDPDMNYGKMRPLYLDHIAKMFPKLKIIGAHLGNLAFFWEAVEVIKNNKNIYYDLTGGTIRMMPLSFFKMAFSVSAKPNLSSTKEIILPGLFDKFVFGTDNPGPGELLAFYNNLMRLLKIKENVRQKVLGLTAENIFKL
ncbi:MAG: amidohydrolase family protein [Candidatus Firestonebacteria bacterium]